MYVLKTYTLTYANNVVIYSKHIFINIYIYYIFKNVMSLKNVYNIGYDFKFIYCSHTFIL